MTVSLAIPVANAAGAPSAPSLGSGAPDLAASLEQADRPAADAARDSGRKPAEVLTFLGIGDGMTVIDLLAAGGYYTEVLATAVGPSGRVYAQNNQMVLTFRDGANDKAIAERLAGNRLPNVTRWDREFADLGLEPNSLDAAITALNFHDIYNRPDGAAGAAGFLASIKAILKPGGVLGIIDHVGVAGADNTALHRIEPRLVGAAAEAAGFVVEASGEMLANPDDPHNTGVFDPSVRGHTDRFVLLLRKPG